MNRIRAAERSFGGSFYFSKQLKNRAARQILQNSQNKFAT
jgi:hypothetical protein